MRVALHHKPLRFGPGFIAAKLSPGNKELLIGREAIDRGRRRLALLRLLECQISNLHACQVADGFAQNQFALVMNVGFDVVAIELGRHALRLGLKLLQVIGGPPVVQPSLGIVLGSLIVEAVTDLVANDDADRAVVVGIGCLRVKSRWLQDSGGEDNLVQQRIVVGVGGGRRHAPATCGPRVCRWSSGHRSPGTERRP